MRAVFAVSLALVLSSCVIPVGNDFAKPDPARLVLGQTTHADILAIDGLPTREATGTTTETNAPNPSVQKTLFDAAFFTGSVVNMLYQRYESVSPIIQSGIVQSKSLRLFLWNDHLIFFNFLSTYPEESTDFDESKTALLKKGETTKDDAVKIFGPPTGRAIYPAIQVPGDELFQYQYVAVDRATRLVHSKLLSLIFDAKGQLADFRFSSAANPLPPAPSPSPAIIPIIIPR